MAKHTIGSRIVIEGEKEYNAALRNIREEQKELRSEMNLCTETYRESANSLEALQKKSELLTKQLDKQAEAVEIQRKKLEAAEKAQSEAGQKADEYREALAEAKKELARLETATDSSAEAVKNQKLEIEEMEKKLILAEQSYGKAETATIRYSTALNNAEAEHKALENELEKVNRCMAEAETSADGCAKSIDQYGKAVKETGNQAKEFGEKAETAIEALADAIVASGVKEGIDEVKEALTECTEKAAEFELAMTKVYTIADEVAVTQSEMAGQILENSTKLVQSSNELADAAYNAISAGVDTQNAVEFSATSTKLAIAGFTDATTSVDILTTTLNAYGLEIEATTSISDMLITTQNEGKVTVDELAASMGKVIPLAAAYNMDMANLSATYAKLTANGVKAAESTTYIKAMLSELGDSGSKVAEILGEETGKSFAELMEDGYSLGEVLEILNENVEGDTGAFNELWSSSEAGIGALSLLGSGVDEFNRVLDKMNNSAGTTEAAFEKMTDTTEYAQRRMQIAAENLQIAIGEKLNPALNEFYNDGTDVLDWATTFADENPEIVQAIAAIAAGVGTATVAVTGITAAVAAFNVVMNATNPIILVTSVALGALIAGYAALSNSSESSAEELRKEAEALKATTEAQREKIETTEAELAQQEAQFAQTRDLIQKIVELNAKEQLSATEKAELADRIKILQERIPSLTLEIDEQTGRLKENTEAFAELAEEQLQQDELLTLEQARAENMVVLQEAEAELSKREAERLEIEKEMEEPYRRILELQEKMNNGTMLSDEETELRLLNDQYALIYANYEVITEAINEQNVVVDEARNNYDALMESTVNVTEAQEEANKVYVEYKDHVRLVSEEVASSIDTLNVAYAESKAAAEESIKRQVGLFDELSAASDLTTAEMAGNLQTQTETFIQYKDDLLAATELVKEGVLDEGLLGAIQEMGVSGAGYLHELVAASKTDAEAYAEVVASYEEMVEARTALTETMADLELNYTAQMDDLLGVTTLKYGELVATTDDAYEEMQANIEQALADLESMQAEGMSSMVTAVTEQYPEMQAAGEALGNAAAEGLIASMGIVDDGSSEVFESLGRKIPESMAQGIRNGQELITTAVQEVIDTAVSEADMSGLSGKIDRMLGEAFS